MITTRNANGVTFVELMVVVALLSVVSSAGFILFNSSQTIWEVTDTRMRLQQDARQALSRLSVELQESGMDSAGALQVTLFDGVGPNGSDILRFSIPLCLCGTSPIDSNGDVRNWGAPLVWGQSGCANNYTVQNNGKVAICHLPPGNPGNTQNLNVSENAIKAHLAHGDWIGACAACDPGAVTNTHIEYLIDGNENFIRRVLDGSGTVVASVIFARNVTAFQAALGGGQSTVDVNIELLDTARQRAVTVTADAKIKLRNIN